MIDPDPVVMNDSPMEKISLMNDPDPVVILMPELSLNL